MLPSRAGGEMMTQRRCGRVRAAGGRGAEGRALMRSRGAGWRAHGSEGVGAECTAFLSVPHATLAQAAAVVATSRTTAATARYKGGGSFSIPSPCPACL
eukprot:5654811-Prymnesium_polylepis.3